jgi:pimeloyl-ACP methyl ester carboxylesterase
MKRSLSSHLMLVGSLLSALPCLAARAGAEAALDYGNNAAAGHTVQVGDAQIYYEIYGHGPTVVLLHGGLFGYIDEYKNIIPALSRDRTVVAVALRGHGKSEVGKQPLSYALLSEDVVAVIRQVTKEPVDLVGFSVGAITAYRLTVRHPELVRSLVVIGGLLGGYGMSDESLAGSQGNLDVNALEKGLPPQVVARTKLNPDRGAFARLATELQRLGTQLVYVDKDEVRSIKVPTLVASGDRDGYSRLEHTVEAYRLLPKGQLALVPGCGHVVFFCRPDLVLLLVQGFLAENGGTVTAK